MVATNLLTDLLAPLGELPADEAAGWVRAAMAEAAALRRHDERLFPLDGSAEGLAFARALHAAWRAWAETADAVADHLPGGMRGYNDAALSDEDREAWHRFFVQREWVRFFMSQTPDEALEDFRQRQSDLERGINHNIPHEEVVREFRARVAARRRADVSVA